MKIKKHILPIIIALAIVACENNSVPNENWIGADSVSNSEKEDGDSDQNLIPQKAEIIIKNKNDYSNKFIKGLDLLDFRKIELIDSLLILDGIDTVFFPTKSKFGKQAVYTGIQDNLAIAITVKWVNYTTIEYRIEMTEFGKTSHNQNGKAELGPSFFFGAESNDDERTGESFFVTEFTDHLENSCNTRIRLGDDGRLAKLYKNCNGKIRDIDMDNFGTLHRK